MEFSPRGVGRQKHHAIIDVQSIVLALSGLAHSATASSPVQRIDRELAARRTRYVPGNWEDELAGAVANSRCKA
jgi:hypothetical protein